MEKYIGPIFTSLLLGYFVYYFGNLGVKGILRKKMRKLRWSSLIGSEGNLGYLVYDKENDEWLNSDEKIIKGRSAQITGIVYILISLSSFLALILRVLPAFFAA